MGRFGKGKTPANNNTGLDGNGSGMSVAATGTDGVSLDATVDANANSCMDLIFGEIRNRRIIEDRVGIVRLPEFVVGDTKISASEFGNFGDIYRDGNATLNAIDALLYVLEGPLSCHNVSYRCKFLHNTNVSGALHINIFKISLRISLLVQNNRIKIQSLAVENIGDFEIVEMSGVPRMMRWLATRIATKTMKENNKVVSSLAAAQVCEQLDAAIVNETFDFLVAFSPVSAPQPMGYVCCSCGCQQEHFH